MGRTWEWMTARVVCVWVEGEGRGCCWGFPCGRTAHQRMFATPPRASSNSSEPPPLLPLPALRLFLASLLQWNPRKRTENRLRFCSVQTSLFFTKQQHQEQNFPLIFVLSFTAVHFRGRIPSHRQQNGKKRNALQQHCKQIANIIVSMHPANPGQHIQRLAKMYNTIRGFPVVHLPGWASILSLFDAKWVQNECLVTALNVPAASVMLRGISS